MSRRSLDFILLLPLIAVWAVLHRLVGLPLSFYRAAGDVADPYLMAPSRSRKSPFIR